MGLKSELLKKVRAQARDAISIFKTVLLTVIIVFLLTHFIIVNAIVPTGSMENTIMTGDRIIGTRLDTEYKRGDIVIFNDPEQTGKQLIKRIIGLPGDHLVIREEGSDGTGYIYLNGKVLNEPYLKEPMKVEAPFANVDMYVPKGMYYCLGDNRNHSYDARYWTNKYISEDDIIARALLRYWPVSNIGFIDRDPYPKS